MTCPALPSSKPTTTPSALRPARRAGVSVEMISRIEGGESIPSLHCSFC